MIFVLIAILIAPQLGRPEFGGIFTFIQEFQGFISPGILAIFVFGLLVHRAPRVCGTVGLLLNPVLYGSLKVAGAADRVPRPHGHLLRGGAGRARHHHPAEADAEAGRTSR